MVPPKTPHKPPSRHRRTQSSPPNISAPTPQPIHVQEPNTSPNTTSTTPTTQEATQENQQKITVFVSSPPVVQEREVIMRIDRDVEVESGNKNKIQNSDKIQKQIDELTKDVASGNIYNINNPNPNLTLPTLIIIITLIISKIKTKTKTTKITRQVANTVTTVTTPAESQVRCHPKKKLFSRRLRGRGFGDSGVGFEITEGEGDWD
ncbi:hypothetical protein HYFRA_00001049 [Hymenoscyphus fraxineus]|uniref:Uncharacterized protein n=1 Tax=Hymenoscyphus fraxineus TaxID=746836 RepID=A0A9N9KQZ8_9HELO|nr:hypothetical protein HYFRA_00001049 [Hymenoscyphus fraxineus]